MAELGNLFPSISLVAEEDSAFIRSANLVDSVVNVVTDKTSSRDKALTQDDVLEAIDRGGTFGPKPATYWVCFYLILNLFEKRWYFLFILANMI